MAVLKCFQLHILLYFSGMIVQLLGSTPIELHVVSVATEETDGYRRMMRSASVYGVQVHALGLDSGLGRVDMSGAGGVFKLHLLARHLERLVARAHASRSPLERLVLLFVDSYDVLFLNGSEEILTRFQEANASILFSAENSCWPFQELANRYPAVGADEKRFLNSGAARMLGVETRASGTTHLLLEEEVPGAVGLEPVREQWRREREQHSFPALGDQQQHEHEGDVLAVDTLRRPFKAHAHIEPLVDDQLFYTRVFLDPLLSKELGMKLDVRSTLFGTLHASLGALAAAAHDAVRGERERQSDLELEFTPAVGAGDGEWRVRERWTGARPCVLHANGPPSTKLAFGALANYLARAWLPTLPEAGSPPAAADERFERSERAMHKSPALTGGRCLVCEETRFSLDALFESAAEYPSVVLAVFVEKPTPFLEEFFERLVELDYPKERIDLLVHNQIEYHVGAVQRFFDEHSKQYRSSELLDQLLDEGAARKSAIYEYVVIEKPVARRSRCVQVGCAYVFAVDAEAHLDAHDALRALIEANRSVLAPLLTRPESLWSTFWGALDARGFYTRSHDYVDIVSGLRRGIWNVPHVHLVYLVRGALAAQLERAFEHPELDPDMSFTHFIRSQLQGTAILMHVWNERELGHLVNTEGARTEWPHAELWEVQRNRADWERRYLHAEYRALASAVANRSQPYTKSSTRPSSSSASSAATSAAASTMSASESNAGDGQQPVEHSYVVRGTPVAGLEELCPDVFAYPLFSPLWARHVVELMEAYAASPGGGWSGGTNEDSRLEGGYENVPTRDIHMRQVGLEAEWLHILKQYVTPIQLYTFAGYYHEAYARMNFVVRYHPQEQDRLRPHHDSSTFTLTVALNQRVYSAAEVVEKASSPANQTFEGGGARFIRYNCTARHDRVGWALMHPGRLTHLHEGLPVRRGVRYVMVSFIDP